MPNSLSTVRIIPTYACNLACDYCYASKYIGEYPKMSWSMFSKITDKLVRQNIRQVIFIGGEPTIWPHLNDAIKALYALGIRVSILSNAIIHTENVVPQGVTVNGTNLASPKLRKQILPNLVWYRERGVHISLRFNLRAIDSLALLKSYAKWGKEYADSIRFSPIVPYKYEEKLGKNLYDFARMVVANGQKISLDRAMPFCVFTEKQIEYLKKHAGFYTICRPGGNQIAINPNGSILPCVDLNMPMPAGRDLTAASERAFQKALKLRHQPNREECLTCKHYKVDCQAGCLSMKHS